MRRRGRLLALLALAPLSLGVAACGGASKGAGSTSQTSSSVAAATSEPATTTSGTTHAQPVLHKDMDNDFDGTPSHSYFDPDDYNIFNYPHLASAADKQAVTTLVKRYMAAAVADDGAAACSLIYSLFAETIPETYGEPPLGGAALRGSTCAQVMSKLFKIHHGQLAVELATLEVASVRVNRKRGLALLRFKGITGRSIQVQRERGTWKVNTLLDTELV